MIPVKRLMTARILSVATATPASVAMVAPAAHAFHVHVLTFEVS
jgi:hypothetical protein